MEIKPDPLEGLPNLLPAEEKEITERKIWSVAKWFNVRNDKLMQNDKKKNLMSFQTALKKKKKN